MQDTFLSELLKQNPPTTDIKMLDAQKQSFAFQMECLKIEIDILERSISRRETVSQGVKNFAVVAWAAAITVILGQNDLRKYIIIVMILPILFWLMDSWWLFLYRGNSFRFRKIHEFVNSSDLELSHRQQKLVNFIVLDTSGRQYKNTVEYKRFVNFWIIFFFKEMVLLYGGLILFSFIIGLIALIVF